MGGGDGGCTCFLFRELRVLVNITIDVLKRDQVRTVLVDDGLEIHDKISCTILAGFGIGSGFRSKSLATSNTFRARGLMKKMSS